MEIVVCKSSVWSRTAGMCRLMAVVAAVLVSSAAYAQRSVAAAQLCFKAVGHADQKSCLLQRALQSEESLRAVEAAFRDRIMQSGEDRPAKARALEAFDQASAQYRKYRERQCYFLATLAFGGNGAGDRRLLCRIELDGRRGLDLENEIKRQARMQ